jgi:AcrR family transcriptional regulator
MRDDPQAASDCLARIGPDPAEVAERPPAAPPSAGSRARGTSRFEAKRGLIINAASALINERGVRGLSFSEVGETIGLGSTSVPYYFRRKEDLAAACFDRALDLLEWQVQEAGAQSNLSSRIRRLISLHFTALEDTEGATARPVVRLSDLRALEDPIRAPLVDRYILIFRRARAFFGEGGSEEERLRRTMRAHVLLENLYNLPIWLQGYDPDEHPRVQQRLMDLLEHGIASGGAVFSLHANAALRADRQEESMDPGERFLAAATRLINERGYRGTSVAQISSELNVTKGSFYHHLEAKDDLVLMCFQRSHAVIRQAVTASMAGDGSRLDQVATLLSTLLVVQLTNHTPLLRTTALPSLPENLRSQIIEESNRIARRIAGLIIDGISESSVQSVDPLVAGQVLLWTINAAYELRVRAARVPIERAVVLYGSTVFNGLLSR